MTTIRLYILAALPAAVCWVTWQSAGWAAEHLNCVARGKDLAKCMLFGLDITSIVGIAWFWGGLLMIPAAILSIVLMAAVPGIRRRATNSTPHPDARGATSQFDHPTARVDGRER